MLLPKRVVRTRRKRYSQSEWNIKRYDFIESDEMVSRIYNDVLDLPISVSTRIKSLDPLSFEHVVMLGESTMTMEESTYVHALNTFFEIHSYSMKSIKPCVEKDGGLYEIVTMSMGRKINDKKRLTLEPVTNE